MLDGVCRQIMQPKRVPYTKFDLSCEYPRQDFSIEGLQCSLYKCNKRTNMCVLFLHGYNGCRLEATDYASAVCQQGLDLCSFDFQASGQSTGEIVTFGLKEEDNVSVLVQYLRPLYTRIILWGRSMGATTALMYSSKHTGIECLILDSPFLVLEDVIVNLIKQKLHTPQLISRGVFELIKRQIQNKYGFSFNTNISLMINCPMLLFACKHDSLIPYEHFTSIYEQYTGPKRIVHIQCNHNEHRPRDIINTAIGFMVSLTPKTKLSPSKSPSKLFGDQDHQYIATGIKIKNKIMRNQSQSNHKNSAKLQKDRAIMQLSNIQ